MRLTQLVFFFHRLLSAYRDKIERPNPKPFAPYFEDLQRAIILKYRPPDSNITATTPTFPEFVDYIIDFTANLTTAQEWDENVSLYIEKRNQM